MQRALISGNLTLDYAGAEALLSELDECLPSPDRTEAAVERAELTDAIVAWPEWVLVCK